MINLYSCVRPLLMCMDAENAHRITLRLLKSGLGPRYHFEHDVLKVKLWGKTFSNPLGLAAGFDKDADVCGAMLRMGFGFVEAGTVTPRPQIGNPRPRIFRDVAQESVINRMGFPGGGLAVFEKNIRAFKVKNPDCIVGANIGMNKDTQEALNDYTQCFSVLSDVADYITVNISSPNTVGLRDLQARDSLDKLLGGLKDVRGNIPLLLKIAPDLTPAQRVDIAALAVQHKIDALIVSNTTISRPDALKDSLKEEKGGLSGRLLTEMSTEVIRDFYTQMQGHVPIVGVGGIASAADAYEKIRAGASLVQVYTALAFQGPALVGRILEGLVLLLQKDGFSNVTEAVGTGVTAVKAVG